MRKSDALNRLLEDHTPLYAGDRVPVRFARQPHYAGPDHGGPYLAVNPNMNEWLDTNVSGANELRLVRVTLAHEGFEYRLSHPSAKEAFARRHAGADPTDSHAALGKTGKAAGEVYNIMRDAWVNTTMGRTYPGLRRSLAFLADHITSDDGVDELPPADALLTGLHQITYFNTAHGIQNADPEIRSLLATGRQYVELCRTAESHEELLALVDALFEKYKPYFETADDSFEEALDDMAGRTGDTQVEDMTDEELQDALDNGEVEPAEPGEADATLDADDLDDETRDELQDALDEADTESGETGNSPDEPQGDERDEDAPSEGSAGSEGEDTDTDAEPAGGPTGPQDAGDDDLLDDMDRLDDMENAAGDVMDLDEHDDYHDPESGDEARYEQVQREQAFGETDWAERMEERDEYDEQSRGDLSSEDIRELMRQTGLAEDLRRAFAAIKTREVTEPTSKPTGNLHLGNVVRHMAGDYGQRDVYETTKKGASGGRTICAVLDASKSMRSSGSIGTEFSPHAVGSIVDAKVMLAALHLAAYEIGDDVVATAFDTNGTDDVRLVTGPDERFEWDHLDGFSARGGWTPTAAGVMDGIRLLERAGGNERVMLVITDGDANRGLADTRWANMGPTPGITEKEAVVDARFAVETARREGITVIGVAVGTGTDEERLDNTFGTDEWIHVESEELVETVVGIYRGQLDDDRAVDAY